MGPNTPGRPPEAAFLTVKALAARWQISQRQVLRYIQSGHLKVHYFGRSIRIAMEDVLLFEFRCRRVS